MFFELLPNELILKIFAYLDAISIVDVFISLNQRYKTLVENHYNYHVDLRRISKGVFKNFHRISLPLIDRRIISLYLSDDEETPNISSNIELERFVHLNSLVLQRVSRWTRWLGHFQQLKRLKLLQCQADGDENQQVERLWALPHLQSLTIDGTLTSGRCFSKLSTNSRSIEILRFAEFDFDLVDFLAMMRQTPQLRILKINLVGREKIQSVENCFLNLRSADINFLGSFSIFLDVLQYFRSIRSLKLNFSRIMFDGETCEKFIQNNLPQLKRFELKSEFRLNSDEDETQVIDQLLNSFRKPFWKVEREKSIRIDWSPSNRKVTLYTIPYAFNEFLLSEHVKSKTTAQANEHLRYDQVKNLRCSLGFGSSNDDYFFRFSFIEYLELLLPCSESIFKMLPTLNHLKTLELTIADSETSFSQLQRWLDRAHHLHQLKFSHITDLNSSIFQLKNPAVRRLDFFNRDSMLYHWYFDERNCSALIGSALGQQCQYLTIDLKFRSSVIELVTRLKNLRTLTFQLRDDSFSRSLSTNSEDELLQWLNQRLPKTCSISRDVQINSVIYIWI